jgi:hypothetical protein
MSDHLLNIRSAAQKGLCLTIYTVSSDKLTQECITLGFTVRLIRQGCVVSWGVATEGLALEMKQQALAFHGWNVPAVMGTNRLVNKFEYELGCIVKVNIPLFANTHVEKSLRMEVVQFLEAVQRLHPTNPSEIHQKSMEIHQRDCVVLTFWDHMERIKQKFREVAKSGWYWHLSCSAAYRWEELFAKEWGMEITGSKDSICIEWRLHDPENHQKICSPREGTFGAELFQISAQEQVRIREEVKKQCTERRLAEKEEEKEKARKIATDPSYYLRKIQSTTVWKMQESAPSTYQSQLPVESVSDSLDGVVVTLKDGRKAQVRVTVEWTD